MTDLPVIRYSWYDPLLGLLWTQSDLLQQGWTKARIRDQLGEPDCYGLNPRGGNYVLLYSRARTELFAKVRTKA